MRILPHLVGLAAVLGQGMLPLALAEATLEEAGPMVVIPGVVEEEVVTMLVLIKSIPRVSNLVTAKSSLL